MSQNADLTFKDLLQLMWNGRWTVLPITLAVGVVGSLYVQTLKPIYQVDALVQIESKEGGKGGLNPLGAMADVFEMNNPAETEIEILKSRMVLGQVVKMRGMDVVVTPAPRSFLDRLRKVAPPALEVTRLEMPEELVGTEFQLTLGDKGAYTLRSKILAGEIKGKIGVPVDSTGNAWKVGLFVATAKQAKPGDVFTLKRKPLLDAISSVSKEFGASELGKKTGIVKLTFMNGNPVIAASILNDIANTYVRQNVERKSAEAEKTLEFLESQMPEIKKGLEESEQRLNSYRIQVGSVDLTEEAKLALGQQVATQQKLVELEQKKKESLQHFKADHPNVRTIDSLTAVILAEAKIQDAQVKALPEQQQAVVRLMRDVQVNTELYTGLLNNVQQLKVVKAGEIGNVRVVDYALPRLKPVKPQRSAMILLSFVLGLFLGGAVMLVRRLLQGGVEDPRVVEKELGLPVYATVPHSEDQQKLHRRMKRREKGVHLLSVQVPDDLAVESLRSLRTTLHFSMLDATNKILLLVGPSPNLGKSFVTANFAATLAQAGHKVLLLDADLRRGHLHNYFGGTRGKGFSDILSGKMGFDEVVRETGVEGLSLLTTGALPPNPSELLMHENCLWLFQQIQEKYDYVVIDSAPVLAVTDATIIGKIAGTTLMILKHGKHPIAEIEACQKRLSQADVTLKGVVFNDVDLKAATSSVTYGTAAYTYGYKQDPNKA